MHQIIKNKILNHAIPLQQFGLNSWGWEPHAAIIMLNSIMQDAVGVFGGDVYTLTQHYLEPLSDNWSCEPNMTESESAFFIRSKHIALRYIEQFPLQSQEHIIFAITFTIILI